jgi:hypothetical protein
VVLLRWAVPARVGTILCTGLVNPGVVRLNCQSCFPSCGTDSEPDELGDSAKLTSG